MSSQNIRHEVFYGPLPYQPGYRTGRVTGPPGREKETAENNERAEDIYHHLKQRSFIKTNTPSHLQREILNIVYPAYGEVPLIDANDHDFNGPLTVKLHARTDTSPLCSRWCRQGSIRLFSFILASLMPYVLVR
jgi:hypothetical protein